MPKGETQVARACVLKGSLEEAGWVHVTRVLRQRQEDKTLLGHLRRSNRNRNLKLRSLFLFFLPILPPRSCNMCCPSEYTHKLCGSGCQGDITYWAGNAALSLLLLKVPAIHSFLYFFSFTLCRDTSAQFLLIPFCSNIPSCSGTFKCLLGQRYLKVNHDYVVQNFRVFLSCWLTTSHNRLINPPGSH